MNKKKLKRLRRYCEILTLQAERLELEERLKELQQSKQPLGFHGNHSNS